MPDAAPTAADVVGLLRSRNYLVGLVFVAILGVPIAAAAYWYLYLVADLQKWLFNPAYLLQALGFHGEPSWWPIPMVGIAGVLVGLAIRYLPGRGGHSPADGLQVGSPPTAIQLPGVALAALAGLALGAVIGPEAPLIALGGGLAVAAIRVVNRDTPAQTVSVIGAAGSFSAIAALFGSPLSSAFLLMEASGLGGPMMGLVLVPGLLAAGVGSLIFIGFDNWTGHGTVSLTVPNLAAVGTPTGAELGWAVAVGVAATVIGAGLRWLGLYLKPRAEQRITLWSPAIGVAVGLFAFAYTEGTGKPSSDVLFSGQAALPSFLTTTASYSIGALLLLLVCKGLAYGLSLSSFRGGPTFPAMFVGAVGGVALSHLPGLSPIAGAGMGIGAMTCAILGLPLTSVLLTTIFLGADGIKVMPVVIIAVVVTYVGRAHFSPRPHPVPTTGSSTAPSPGSATGRAGAPVGTSATSATGPPGGGSSSGG